ncbi:MAG: TolC family protein, partial [Nitrospinaceae bacterium]
GGLLFKYPLGNRDAKSRLAVSKLETAQLLMDIKDLEKTIVVEVREAARQINTDKKRVQAARIARRLAKETLIAEEKKFEVGLSTSFEVLQFQTDLAREQSKELKSVIDFNKSKIKLRKVLAITLEEYNIRMASDPSP